ncbi:MAG: hydantoinase/oxoprolinase family protein, partial [Desulfocapsaceae bacterium]|nr:hydantoinase/oxoprolinase family protein [Desulfocapsaceae bacterium]
VNEALADLQQNGIDSIGIATKFSHRNSEHELWLRDRLKDDFTHISLGHQLSGMPNFPRRVYTTWLNSALKTPFFEFKEAIQKGLATLDVHCPCYVLKADGGTMPFIGGCEFPCQSIHSGPSASVMGALAVVGGESDAILLDIGGTTTDIALLADGIPLLEPYGTSVAGRPTLIRALQTKSIGLGGDSMVVWRDGRFQIGPERQGRPMALGGSTPTPTDAMIVQGTIQAGERTKAEEAMLVLRPDSSAEQTSSELLAAFSDHIYDAAQEMIEEIFSRPVYTVSAFLEREKIRPDQLIVIGGPAQALQGALEHRFGLSTLVPADYEVANAIGAARARLTVQASLYGDTTLGRMSIPEVSVMENVGRRFDMLEAETRLFDAITLLAGDRGVEKTPAIDFIERLEINTVKGFATTGKIISLKAQIRPGLAELEE